MSEQLLKFKVVDKNGEELANTVIEFTTTGTEVLAEGELSMDQIQSQFKPHVLVIKKGQLVTFPNSDKIRHHVYSFSKAKTFEIKLFASNSGAPLLFSEPGVVVLGCNIHDNMVGYIYVANSKYVGKTNRNGVFDIDVDSGIQKLTFWHPQFTKTGSLPIKYQLKELARESNESGVDTYLVSLPVERPKKTTKENESNNEDKFLDFQIP